MNETEPLYFKEFRVHIDKRFDQVEVKIDKEVECLARSTANYFNEIEKDIHVMKEEIKEVKEELREIDEKLATKAEKSDIDKVLKHIGSYEIRARNVEETLHEDHKPRIIDLEHEVYRF